MTILNFVTQDELDNLSEDPPMAFMELVNHAQRRLSEQTSKLDFDNQYELAKKFDLERSFMNVVVAAGKRLEIQPFSSIEIPRHQNFANSDYNQFISDLDHYVTQLILDNSIRGKKLSVEILPQSKDQIRSYVHGLKECIEKANMQASKKKALLDKLEEFEKELEKRRMSFVSLSMLAISIIGAPGATWASVDIAHRLINNITQVFAEAKQTEDQTRRIGPQATPKALSPPRSPESKTDKHSLWQEGGDLDDEIPF